MNVDVQYSMGVVSEQPVLLVNNGFRGGGGTYLEGGTYRGALIRMS